MSCCAPDCGPAQERSSNLSRMGLLLVPAWDVYRLCRYMYTTKFIDPRQNLQTRAEDYAPKNFMMYYSGV